MRRFTKNPVLRANSVNPLPTRCWLSKLTRRADTRLSLGLAAVLTLLTAFAIWAPAPQAEAQSAPVNEADKVFTDLDAGAFLTCGVSKAGYIRCWGDTVRGPIRSDEAGYVEVATDGLEITCGRRSNGIVKCWGAGYGLKSWPGPVTPPQPPTVDGGDRDGAPHTFSAIGAGAKHACGLLDGRNGQTEGLVKCWPDSGAGQVPAALATLTFGKLDISRDSACALVKGGDDDGKARCWGTGTLVTQLAATHGIPQDRVDTAFSAISVHATDACAILRDGADAGELACWSIGSSRPVVSQKPAGTFSAVSVGWGHACAIRTDGTPACWGTETGNFQKPHVIPEGLRGATFSSIAADEWHSCGLLDGGAGQVAGTVKCWGLVDESLIGDHDYSIIDAGHHLPYRERDPLPVLSAGPDGLSAGFYHTCATTEAGGSVCWGALRAGRRSIPPSGVAHTTAAFDITCALKTDGAVECWARSDRYAQATGHGGATFSQISGTAHHHCGVLDGQNGQAAGTVKCWGRDDEDQSTVPTELSAATFASVYTGTWHTCGILDGQNGQAAGTVECWGAPPPPGDDYSQAAPPPDGGTFSRLSLGLWHNCGILDEQNNQKAGTLKCWGWNHEHIQQSTVPAGLVETPFVDISVAYFHNCGVTATGRAVCWGNVRYIALDGVRVDHGQTVVPEKYRNARFAGISTSRYHTCAVTPQGRAACWGVDAQAAAEGRQVARPNGRIVNAGQADPQPPAPGCLGALPVELWCSTLTVKDLGHLRGDGCIGQQQCSAQLAPDSSFTYGGSVYNVLAVRVVRGSLQILLDRAPPLHPDQARLDVGGRQFQFKDASESWGIDRNEDAWRLTWHGTGLSWSDGDTVSVSLVGWNVPAPPTPAPNTDLHPVRVHYDEMRDGEPVDNFNNLRLASPNPSGTPGRRVELRAYIPGTFPSADPEKGIVTTTHVMLRVRAHPDSTLEWAIGNVHGVTGTFAAFDNGGFTPEIALNPASKWTYVYLKVTNGGQSAIHFVAIDPPPRTYTLTPKARVAEGEEAALTLSLGSPAGAGGVSFTVAADYPDGGATAGDVGEIATSVTVPEGQQSARIIIPTVDDEEVEDEERFTVRVAHVGEPAWAVDPEGTDTAVVTIADNDEPPAPPEGPEPWDIRVVPGDGTLTVTWNVGSRDGVEDSEIWHVLRWSQEPGVWANPRDPRAVGKNDGLSVDPGLTGYTITGLENGVATGVFVRSMVGHRNNMSEREGNSSEWVRVKGEHTTPVAPPNAAPTVSSAIADATITNESGTHEASLSGVFGDADGDDLTITANSSDDSLASVSVAADYSTLTVSAQGRGTATVTVTAADGNGGSVEAGFTITVKAAPVVASGIDDVTGLEVDATHEVSMSGVFSDADGDTVTVTEASSSDSAIAAVSAAIDGSTAAITAVTVTANSEGTATITVTAEDADGNSVSGAFDVTVNAAAQQQQVNEPPTLSSAIADATIVSESGTHEASLSGVFTDADGDALTITASSSDENTVTVSVSADYSTLTVTAKARGTATITVTAADGYGGSVEDSFIVRVKAAPVVASAIADVSSLEEGATREVSLSGVFSDADGDSLTVTAASSDEGKATVAVAADRSALTVSGMSEGTATITVTAQDADGNTVSDAFKVEVVQVPEPEPEPVELPGPVVGLELTATHDSVSVSWSAPESGDPPDGYIVNIKRQGGGDGETRRPGANKTSLTFRDLNGGSTYEVWVRAQNEAGKGERTHATITLPVELPGPVTGLEVVATGDGVTVSWSAPETGGAPDGYIVHVRPEGGAEGSGRTKTPKAKKTQVSFENLEVGRTYQVWVRAENEAGKGERVHATVTLPEDEPAQQHQGDQDEPADGQQQDGQTGQ